MSSDNEGSYSGEGEEEESEESSFTDYHPSDKMQNYYAQ